MESDDINEYFPSLIAPRAIKKNNVDLSITQGSCFSRCSLSLKKNRHLNNLNRNIAKNQINKTPIQNPRQRNISSPKRRQRLESTVSLRSLTNFLDATTVCPFDDTAETFLIGNRFSDKENISVVGQKSEETIEVTPIKNNRVDNEGGHLLAAIFCPKSNQKSQAINHSYNTYSVASSNTELYTISNSEHHSKEESENLPQDLYIEFGVKSCKHLGLSSNKSSFTKIDYKNQDADVRVKCILKEGSQISTESSLDENMNEVANVAQKRSQVSVHFEIKKKKITDESDNARVLILKSNYVDKLSHVILQPPADNNLKGHFNETKLKAKQFFNSNKPGKSRVLSVKPEEKLKQSNIINYFRPSKVVHPKAARTTVCSVTSSRSAEACSGILNEIDLKEAMSKKHDAKVSVQKKPQTPVKNDETCKSMSKALSCITSVNKAKLDITSVSGTANHKHGDTISFTVPRPRSIRAGASPKEVPPHKLVSGTPFAVDAFSYGDIPNVKAYFLTHFHTDHYYGLRRSFSRNMYCSKITAELCISRLGLSPRFVNVINLDESVMVEGVKVTAVDANHCPGAIMLVFTLPGGRSVLHTGDFRASFEMESYPAFWNHDIHTVYLDTTYCNPRYDFPSQDECLNMALEILQEKKRSLDKCGRRFANVLIVCGTYTIGKEKFFTGLARQTGCPVWACPEKDKILQIVEGRSPSTATAQGSQIHVLPMRELTHEKLKTYLGSLNSSFCEVVAFKPSGWENVKPSSVERDSVTIHGIPYSEHSSFSELMRFINFLKPKLVIPTVEVVGGIKAAQKYFPCPVSSRGDHSQTRLTEYFGPPKPSHDPSPGAVT